MASRVLQLSPALTLRFVRCLMSNSPSSVLVFTASRPTYARLVTAACTTRKQRSLCTGSSENPSSQDEELAPKISIESTEFAENVSTLAASLGLTQSQDLVPALVHRSYLTAHAMTLKKQHKDNDQLALLGLQTSKRFLTELLLNLFPHLSSQELWDTQNGILENQVQSVAQDLQLAQYIAHAHENTVNENLAAAQSLMAIVAVVYIHEGPEKARQLIHEKFISNLDETQVNEMIKLEHPKYILRSLSQKSNSEPIRLRFLRRNKNEEKLSTYKIGVFKADQCLAVGKGSTSIMAEKKACQSALCKVYPDELKSFSFSCEAEDFESEDQIDLGLVTPRQRVVTLDKEDNEFGFNIKGGEKKRLKNKDWLAYNYFSPIFISSIQPDGLAGRVGNLRLGDVILAVNDKSLVGVNHDAAVKVLKKASGSVTLTVRHSKEVLVTDRVETDYKKMKQRKRLAELTSEVWAEWHQAQADKHPEKYADVLDFKENVASQ